MDFTVWDVILGIGGAAAIFIVIPLLLLVTAGVILAAVIQGAIHLLTPEMPPKYVLVNQKYASVSPRPAPPAASQPRLTPEAKRGIARWSVVAALFGLITPFSLFLSFYIYYHAAIINGLLYALFINISGLTVGLALLRQRILPDDVLPRRGWLAALGLSFLTGWLAGASPALRPQPLSCNCQPLPINDAIFPAAVGAGMGLITFTSILYGVEWWHIYGQAYQTWRWIPALLAGAAITFTAIRMDMPPLFRLVPFVVPLIVLDKKIMRYEKLWKRLALAPAIPFLYFSLTSLFIYWLSAHIAAWQMTPPDQPSAALWLAWIMTGLIPGAIGGVLLVYVWQMQPHPVYPYSSRKIITS